MLPRRRANRGGFSAGPDSADFRQQSEATDASRRECDPRDRHIERLERGNTRLHEDFTSIERDRDRWKRPRRLLQQLDPDRRAAVKVDRGTTQCLPMVHALVRRFNIKVGHYSHCRRQVQGRHALQTSYAPAAGSMQLGLEVVAFVVHLHKQLGTPLTDVKDLPTTRFGTQVTLS